MRKKVQVLNIKNNKNYSLFLLNLIKKLVDYMKITYVDIDELIKCIKKMPEWN